MPGVTKTENFVHPESLIQRTKTTRSEKYVIDAQRGFHANIHFMDTQVNRLLTSLQDNDLLDNSWIVFFSDQGVMEGAHGLAHKNTLFRQITQPSLIVRTPNGIGGGTRVTQPIELMDLLPTFLEIGGVTSEQPPNGTTLVPLFSGKTIARPYVFGEIEDWVVVSDGHYRLIQSMKNEGSLLFDDNADPDDLKNLADDHPEIVKTHRDAIDQWLKQTGPRLQAKPM